jgi:hypothetical protein
MIVPPAAPAAGTPTAVFAALGGGVAGRNSHLAARLRQGANEFAYLIPVAEWLDDVRHSFQISDFNKENSAILQGGRGRQSRRLACDRPA